MFYTRKGDQGTTKIINSPERILKCSSVIEALGSVDELNSFLGFCKAKSGNLNLEINNENLSLSDLVHEAQENLFIIQAELAGADKKIFPDKIKRLEYLVDGAEKQIPPVNSFFISGGTELSALFDISRTLARKAERRVVAAIKESKVKVSPETISYLNRLSSLLYAIVRSVNNQSNIAEKKPSYN